VLKKPGYKINNKPITGKQGEHMRNKIKSLLIITAFLATGSAFADGFVCNTADAQLKIALYNQVNPNEGTRNPSTLILSDNMVAAGRKTVARFTADSGNLFAVHSGTAQGLAYVGNVDLRFNDTGRAGEYLMGTRLGEVDYVQIKLDFTYSMPQVSGAEVLGHFYVVKRSGDTLSSPVYCVRYLKQS